LTCDFAYKPTISDTYREVRGWKANIFLDKWDYVISFHVYQTHCLLALLLFAV